MPLEGGGAWSQPKLLPCNKLHGIDEKKMKSKWALIKIPTTRGATISYTLNLGTRPFSPVSSPTIHITLPSNC